MDPQDVPVPQMGVFRKINDSLKNKHTPSGAIFSEKDDLTRRGLLYESLASGHLYVRQDIGQIPPYILNRLDAAMPFGIGPPHGVVPVAL